MLHRGGIQVAANLAQNAFPGCPILAGDANFHELVGLQAGIDFPQDRGREATVANHHDGIESVGPGAQRASFTGTQWNWQAVVLRKRKL